MWCKKQACAPTNVGTHAMMFIVILKSNRDRECYFITFVATVVPSV